MDKLQNFVVWLDGYLDAVGDDKFNISKTNLIKNKLNRLFDHEADKLNLPPKKTLEELGEEHGFKVNKGLPGENDDDEVIYRC